MTKKKKLGLKLRPGYTSVDLGRLTAEDDKELQKYYVRREKYVDRAINMNDAASYFVGAKGSGKSAVLQMVRVEFQQQHSQVPTHVIDISPTQLAFSAFAHIDVTSPLMRDASKTMWLYKTVWDYIIVTEVGSREYPDQYRLIDFLMSAIRGYDERQLRNLLRLSLNDQGKPETFAGRFMKLVKEIEISGDIGAEGGKIEVKTKIDPNAAAGTGKYGLLSLVHQVSTRLADTMQSTYYILIDDLDVDWHNEQTQNAIIAAMFSSLRKICRPPNLKCVVSIQERIMRELPIEHMDKFRDSICYMDWDHDTVKEIVERRISRIIEVSPAKVWGSLMPENGFDFIWERIAGRPREAIRLASLCLAEGQRNESGKITDVNMVTAYRKFSKDRVDDIAKELDYLYPGFDIFLRCFTGYPKEFPFAKFKDAVDFAILKSLDEKAPRYIWVQGYEHTYHELVRLMLENGILLYTRSRTDPAVPYEANQHDFSLESPWLAFHHMYIAGLGLIGKA